MATVRRHHSVAEIQSHVVGRREAQAAHHAKITSYDRETAIAVLLEGTLSEDVTKDWDIRRVLGHGAFGTVFEVKSEQTGELAALKVIQKSKVTDPSSLERELSALRRCCHPSITRLMSIYEDHHAQYLILEECKGGDMLDYIMDKGILSYTQAAYLFQETTKGLAYIHDKEMVHRDIKLDNLLLVDKDNVFKGVKISDFGIARLFPYHENPAERAKALATDTVEGCEFAGSLQYMAPEIVRHENYNFKADLWSMGVVLYSVMFAGFPYGGSNNELIDTLSKITGGPDFGRSMFSSVDTDLTNLLSHLLDVNQQTRYDCKEALSHKFITKMQSEIHARVPQHHSTPGSVENMSQDVCM